MPTLPSASCSDALDTAEALRQLTLDCYIRAIKNVAHYAIELDGEATKRYRNYVNALAGEVEVLKDNGDLPNALRESSAALRALLRDYRDRASAYLNHLREELATTAGVLQRHLDSLSQSESDSENRLLEALKNLRRLSGARPDEETGPAIQSAADDIEQSLSLMRQQQ